MVKHLLAGLLGLALMAPAAHAESGTIRSESVPAKASAASGSITNVHPALDGEGVLATYTTTFTTCTEYGYCGWFPHAWEVPATSSCYVDKSYLTYVGEIEETSATQTGTDTFYPHFNPTRICLYAYHAGQEHFVADYVYTAPSSAPPPSTDPPIRTEPDEEVPPLPVREARREVGPVLKKEYGSRYTKRRGRLSAACTRWDDERVRCRVTWVYKKWRYRGHVTMRNDPEDATYLSYRYSIRRYRL